MVDPTPSTPQVQLTNPQDWWQYGVLGACFVIALITIRYLFREYKLQIKKNQDKDSIVEKERTSWAVDKERIRSEFEVRHNELLKTYTEKMRDEHTECQRREDALRKEHEDTIERMAEEQSKAADALIEMLKKLQERMVFTRPRSGGY